MVQQKRDFTWRLTPPTPEAENSHQQTRQLEKLRRGFKSTKKAQRLLSTRNCYAGKLCMKYR